MYEQGWAVVPGQCRDPGPENPRDFDRNRDSKPQDARDRDKNLRDNKSRHFGPIIPLSPGTVHGTQIPYSPRIQFDAFFRLFRHSKIQKTRDCPVPSLAHPWYYDNTIIKFLWAGNDG